MMHYIARLMPKQNITEFIKLDLILIIEALTVVLNIVLSQILNNFKHATGISIVFIFELTARREIFVSFKNMFLLQ